jgi:serine/threonine-protein kinase
MDLKRLGKYEIVGKIGEGGMGEVYRASDPVLNRQVAIKTMSGGGAGEEELRKRFLREAQSAALLNHINIVTVYDFGEEQGRMYIVMELLEGGDLKRVIQGPMQPLRARLALMEQVCDGLGFAHAKGVIHRDLKPANIHVAPDGRVKIMDFGLARVAASDITRTGLIMGTPHYMSPEQVKGETVTTRSDVFSLGAVFHELLCGRKAFNAESMHSVMYQVANADPLPLESLQPDVPRALAELVRAALAKDPARRPADAGELGQVLRAAVSSLSAGETQMIGVRPAPAPARAGDTAHARPRGQTVPQPALVEARSLQPTVRQEEPTAVAAPTLAETPTELAQGGGAAARATPARPRAQPVPARGAPGAVRRTGAIAVGALAIAGAGLLALVLRSTPDGAPSAASSGSLEPPPASLGLSPPPPATSGPTAPDADSARRALLDRDYRRAADLAGSVLAAEPASAAARETLAAAQEALRQGTAAAERVRSALRARDALAATQALGRLVTLDPRNPELPELTRGLEGLAREATPRTAAAEPATPVPDRPRVAETAPEPSAPAAAAGSPGPAPPPASLQPAPATPAPATPPPAAAPPVGGAAVVTPENAVRQTLADYQAACARVDLLAIRRVFPLIRDASVKAIEKMSRYDVRFEDVAVRFEGERAAIVTAQAFYEATPRDARRTPTRTQKRETIRLEKGRDGAWVIRAID